MKSYDPFRPDDLVQHAAALRRLAGKLTGDGHADDVVQQAYVTALEQPPQSRRPLRSWLLRVIRSRAHDQNRANDRRRHHETQATARNQSLHFTGTYPTEEKRDKKNTATASAGASTAENRFSVRMIATPTPAPPAGP